MNILAKLARALRAPSKETQRPLWILHMVMISVLLGFKLIWIIWEPGKTTGPGAFTWAWVGVLAVGFSVEVVLRLRARSQRRGLVRGDGI